MKKITILSILMFAFQCMGAQNAVKCLEVKTRIDSIYAFGFNLKESRSAKGGIWNIETGKPETPQNYSQMRRDTVDCRPVVRLYREVAMGNHPLNGWETWIFNEGHWVCTDDGHPSPASDK